MKRKMITRFLVPALVFASIFAFFTSGCSDVLNNTPVNNPPGNINLPDTWFGAPGALTINIKFNNDSVYTTNCFIVQGGTNMFAVGKFPDTNYTIDLYDFADIKDIRVYRWSRGIQPATMWSRISKGAYNFIVNTCTDTMTYDKTTRILKLMTGSNEQVHQLTSSETFYMNEYCRR